MFRKFGLLFEFSSFVRFFYPFRIYFSSRIYPLDNFSYFVDSDFPEELVAHTVSPFPINICLFISLLFLDTASNLFQKISTFFVYATQFY
jgi:hypothetical protein